MNIIELINDFKRNQSALWLENDTIKLFVSEAFKSERLKEKIVDKKSQLIRFLSYNKIFSQRDFTNREIFRSENKTVAASFAQERLWFVDKYQEGTAAYHIPVLYELNSEVNLDSVRYAIQQIVSRHEILRSTIEQNDHTLQIVHTSPLEINDVTVNKDDVDRLIQEDINNPFDLHQLYPIRVKIYNILGDEESYQARTKTILLITIHHIASDGWSQEIFQKELYLFYNAHVKNNLDFKLPDLEIQYKDFSVWQHANLDTDLLNNQLSYWKEKLSGYQTLDFRTDYNRPREVDYSGSQEKFVLSKQLSNKLRSIAQQNKASLSSVILASLNILLGKYTGQEDILIGSAIANRQQHQVRDLIGFFVNTQAIRTQLGATQSFSDLIRQVHGEQIEAQSHQDLPFEKLINELQIERDQSRHPLFQVMYGFQSFKGRHETAEEFEKLFKPKSIEPYYAVEKFDLSFFLTDDHEELSGQVSYATSLFKKETIIRFVDHYVILLEQLSAEPGKEFSKMSLLKSEEFHKIVYQWNSQINSESSAGKTIQELFQMQVLKSPDSIAFTDGEYQFTYRELDSKSNQFARLIRTEFHQRTGHTLTAGTMIALCLNRSPEMIISILGILKAGGAYVPVDPAYPQERIDYMLKDTQAQLIISDKQLLNTNSIQLPEANLIYASFKELQEDSNNVPTYSTSDDLAYVIYTSGTTGKPKGVMVDHKKVESFCMNNNFIDYDKVSVVGGMSNYAFDGSIFDIFFSLLNGKQLSLLDTEVILDLRLFDQALVRLKIDTVLITTALFNSLVQNQAECLGYLKQILFGGESCNKEIVNKFKKTHPNTRLIHVYGPTENIVLSTYCNLSNYDTSHAVPIGKKLADKKLYILDSAMTPVPIGVIGELYVGGGVALRYLNRPDLSDNRFLLNPFVTSADKKSDDHRVYRTGDFVRWLPDGNVEFIGRRDNQVKLRGYRIELGEIEQHLLQIEGIKQCCVTVKEKSSETGVSKYIVGYYVPTRPGLIAEDIIEQLTVVLPDYMIPSILMPLEFLPVTLNGKLDMRALPDPDFGSGNNFVKPETELEVRLAEIYASVLGLKSEMISTHESFFSMGGNSILSIRLKQKLSEQIEFKTISIADIFKYNSIQKLIKSINLTDTVEYHLQSLNPDVGRHEIAIIGMSGAFSGAKNLDDFWQLIANKRAGIRFYNDNECRQAGVDESLIQDQAFVPAIGHVQDIDQFDPLFWNISPNEARLLDPQIRKFIEHCWFALDSAGYAHQRTELSIGVFAGSGDSEYFFEHIRNNKHDINVWDVSSSNNKDALATKAAFFLGLIGPALSINTACSTGLVSVIEACQKLQLGVCDMALAGGVSLIMPDQMGYLHQEGLITSKDGYCRTFDHSASGTTIGSGVGVVLLKRLSDAEKDKDLILGIIKGYGINNDGNRKTGYTAPSVVGQSECIINAQRMAGINSTDIQYVECHGTATVLGDPIEIRALQEAFSFNHSKEKSVDTKISLGSVKSNIGHANSAAGVAGLIKTCLMLQNNLIPAQLYFDKPNKELHLERTNFDVPKQNKAWPDTGKNRLAGISAFGVGGTNAHVILEGISAVNNKASYKIDATTEESRNYSILLSAKSSKSLDKYKTALLRSLTDERKKRAFSLKNLAFTLQERKEHFAYRRSFEVKTTQELIIKLEEDQRNPAIKSIADNKVVLMFPGQGSQYVNMARELYERDTLFKQIVEDCILLANTHLKKNLRDVLFPNDDYLIADINSTEWTQISIFVIEYALAKYLESTGLTVHAYIGHSIGEYVAATLSGVFSLENAIKVVIERGKLMQSMPAGTMLAVHTNYEVIKQQLKECKCEVAAINSPNDVVISGSDLSIEKLKLVLDSDGIASLKLNTSHAYHSQMMDEAAIEFEKIVDAVNPGNPTAKFISIVTGEFVSHEITKGKYWSNQLRNTVQFAKGISTLSRAFNNQVTFIEVGPGKSLCAYINEHKRVFNLQSIASVQLLPSAREVVDQKNAILEKKEDLLGKLWVNGLIKKPNDIRLFDDAEVQFFLPEYQFDFQKCWVEKSKNVSDQALRILSPEKWLSKPVWSAVSKLSANATKLSAFGKALMFVRSEHANAFDFRKFNTAQVVILDKAASRIDRKDGSGNVITLNPGNETHFQELASYLNSNHIDFDIIIHCSSLDNTGYSLNDSLNNSFYSLFLIRQYLLSNRNLKKLVVVTNGLVQLTGDDNIYPSNGTLVGAIRNINHEFIDLDARIIDIGPDYVDLESRLNEILTSETYRKSEDLIGVRFNKLWLQRFENTTPLASDKIIHDGDVILITGGLGGIGLSIAKRISEKSTVKFILVSRRNLDAGRSEYSRKKIGIIDQIIANQSTVEIMCCDISDSQHVHSLLEAAQKKFGAVTGIIHTAGVIPLKPENYALHSVKQAFSGKVQGIDNILATIDLNKLKYIALTSSLASIMGDVNSIEYCAANSYLDYLAINKKKFEDIRIISINWPGWIGIGVSEDNPNDDETGKPVTEIKRLLNLNVFNEHEGADLFYNLINQSDCEQIAVSKLGMQALKTKLFSQVQTSVTGSFKILEDNYSKTEFEVGRIFSEILGLEQISIHDDFFKIGGNSILAIRVSHRMSSLLGYRVTVADLFSYRTIDQLLRHVAPRNPEQIVKIDSDEAVLSFAQERLWFIDQYEEGTNAYNMPLLYELNEEADVAAITYALQQVVLRHEVLRSTIQQRDLHAVQIVHHEPLKIEKLVLSSDKDYEAIIHSDVIRPFNLKSQYPIRVVFYTIKSDIKADHYARRFLLINLHHIASDGWSQEIFRRELRLYYDAYINKKMNFRLPELKIQYKDYAAWQRNYLADELLEKQLNYWKDKLRNYQTLEFPTDFVRQKELSYAGELEKFSLSQELSQKLKTIAKQHGTTLYGVMLSALNILLSKYTGQDDILVGSSTANRQYTQTEGLIGFFVNTQVNRTILKQSESFVNMLHRVQSDLTKAQLYQDLPFEMLVDELGVERDSSRHPIFQISFETWDFSEEEGNRNDFFKYISLDNIYKVEKFDLSIVVTSTQEALGGYFSYATSLFNKNTIINLIEHFKNLLEQLVQSPERAYSEISLVTADEYDTIFNHWNATSKPYSIDKTFHELYQLQVKRTPESIAIMCGSRTLLYQDLDEKSDRLANHIRKEYKKNALVELDKDTLICICVDRGIEMIIGILGILKAGAAYVPINPRYPQERIDYILSDTNAKIVLSARKLIQETPPDFKQLQVIYLDQDEVFYSDKSKLIIPVVSKSDSLAYVIYTSGTTGKPKGALIEHAGMINHMEAMISELRLNANSRLAQNAPQSFDISVWQMLTGLLTGGCTVIYSDEEILSPGKFIDQLTRDNVTILQVVPSYLTVLLDTFENSRDEKALGSLNYLIVTGETVTSQLVKRWFSNFPSIPLVNAYGPAEASDDVTLHFMTNPPSGSLVPIGKNLQNIHTYIVDRYGVLCPVGVTGEIWISGVGVGRGYLNDENKTRAAFIPDPFRKNEGVRLYKTGDLGRWLQNGELEYLGRNDEQVKIRGYRIELGEVEHALTQITGIKQGCIVIKERVTEAGTSKYLAGYYTKTVDATAVNEVYIIERLSELLPEYMVPSVMIELNSFPLTANGKLDKRCLPEVKFNVSKQEYVAPVTTAEISSCQIWQEILGIDRVGVTDDFFRIGGNSILAIQASHRMSKILEIDIKVVDIFREKTIDMLLKKNVSLEVNKENVLWKFNS